MKQTVALAVATLGGLASLAAGLVLVHRGVTLTDAGAWAPALLSALAIHVLALGYACLCGRAPARPHPHVPARVPVKQGRDS